MCADEFGKEDIAVSAHSSWCILADLHIYYVFFVHWNLVTFHLINKNSTEYSFIEKDN